LRRIIKREKEFLRGKEREISCNFETSS